MKHFHQVKQSRLAVQFLRAAINRVIIYHYFIKVGILNPNLSITGSLWPVSVFPSL